MFDASDQRAGKSIDGSSGSFLIAYRRVAYVWKRPRYMLVPDPRREKETVGPAANHGLAAAERRPCR
jgi:hypothetical protein